MKRVDTLYVVTGISRLTDEREAISNPVPLSVATAMLNKWKSKPALKRDYLRLRVESYNLTINFKNKE